MLSHNEECVRKFQNKVVRRIFIIKKEAQDIYFNDNEEKEIFDFGEN